MRTKYECIVDGKLYTPRRATAEFRGFCSMRCQHKLERELGLSKKYDFRSRRYFVAEVYRRRKVNPNADPVERKL